MLVLAVGHLVGGMLGMEASNPSISPCSCAASASSRVPSPCSRRRGAGSRRRRRLLLSPRRFRSRACCARPEAARPWFAPAPRLSRARISGLRAGSPRRARPFRRLRGPRGSLLSRTSSLSINHSSILSASAWPRPLRLHAWRAASRPACRPDRHSNSSNSGTASEIWLKMSGGVSTAATTKMTTIA